MAQSQTIDDKENAALSTSDATGVSDLFAFQNSDELKQDLNVELEDEGKLMSAINELDVGDISPTTPKTAKIKDPLTRTAFESDDKRAKGLFEKMFGYNPESDMPYGYEKMSEYERAAMRAQLAAQNIFRRTGIGATKQATGILQLVLPKSMEEALITDKEKKEFRLPEDRYYEARIQRELEKKQKDTPLSEDEADQLRFLNETMPSNLQRTPEFVGRVAAEIEQFALASQIFRTIRIPGGGTLDAHLSETGRRLLGRELTSRAAAAGLAGKPLTKIGLGSLARQMQKLGPNAAELFIYGVISAETEEGEDAKTARVASGAKMSLWASVPVALAPGATVALKTKAGQITADFAKRAIAKTVSPIADQLAKLQAGKASKTFVQTGLLEADDLFLKENGRMMTSAEKGSMKETLQSIAGQVSKIAKKNPDDITAAIEKISADATGKDPVGLESIIPKVLRQAETAGDDVINGTTLLVENKTNFVTIRQGNRNYAILDKATQQEVAVNIKRKDLAKELDELIFGTSTKAPKKTRTLIGKPKTKLTITEETELKRSLSRMQKASNDGYRAGTKDANEKALIKLNEARERVTTIRADNQQKWENVEYARQLVKEFVPKEDQGRFMARIIKAKTEGGMDKILDDIDVHLNRDRIRNSIDGIRSGLKEAKKKYGDKTGKFAKAPDAVRPLLEKLDAASDRITKFSQQGGDEVVGIGTIADDMITALNETITTQGEVIGIPSELATELYGLSSKKGSELGADGVEALSQLTKLVIHRAEQAHLIKIGPDTIMATQAIDDAFGRVIPRASTEPAGSIKRLFGVDSDHPITLVEKMFGSDSSTRVLLDELYQGETKAYGVMRNSYDMVRSYMTQNKIPNNSFDNLKTKMTVKLGGKSIQITRDDALSLAMSTRDPWVFSQMTQSAGFRLGKHEVKALSADATVKEISDIVAKLTDDEMKLGGAIFDVGGNYLSQVINETSLQVNGIKIATYPQYYPSHRVLSKSIKGNRWAGRTAETQSNFMPRLGGKSPMRIKPYSAEMMDYIQNSAMYNGTAVPMRSLKTVLADKNLQQHLRTSGYGDEVSNFIEIINRSEGMYSDSSVIEVLGSKVLNNFSKSVLGGRISTIGTQIGSVPASKSVIPGKYFKPTDVKNISKGIDDLMTDDFFWHRWTGRRISVEMGDAASKSSLSHFLFNKTPLSEKPLSGLVWGDKQAAGKIYAAATRQVRETTKLTGNEAKQAAIKLTEKAFRETQPNWSVLTRSKLATDAGVFRRSMTMFRTAQEAQFNIWKRANVTFARSPKSSKDIKALKDSYQSVLESQLTVALWKTTWKRGRELGIAKTAGWLGIYTPGDDDPLGEDVAKEIARTVSGSVPLGNAVETLVEASYDKIFKGETRLNTSQDPISSIGSAAAISANQIYGVIDSMLKDSGKREGFTADFMPISIDDLLNGISTSESDKKQKEQELRDKSIKAITNGLRTAGLLTGVAIGPLDEWVAPGLRRSKHKMVRRIDSNNSSNPAELQRDLDKFLTDFADLKKKEEGKGLTFDEASKLLDMKTRKSIIDSLFQVEEAVGPDGSGILDSIEDLL